MRLIRQSIASLFRILFRINFLRYTYHGFYKKLFAPLNLFKGVNKRVRYRKNILLDLQIEDWIQQNLYFLHEYEEKELRFIEAFLKPGDGFVDIGANIGLFSLVASQTVGTEGKVYAFEPFEKNYQSLVHHIKVNQLTNVIAEQKAVADKEGSLQLYLNETEKNLGSVSAFNNPFTASETVMSTSLDAYFNAKDLKIALIKMDIEGGEYLALKGMEQLLKLQKPAILIEINPEILQHTPFDQNDVESFLISAGYKKFFISSQGELIRQKESNDRSNNYLFLSE